MRNKALGISSTSSLSDFQLKSSEKENIMSEAIIRKDPATKTNSPRKSSNFQNNEIVRANNATKPKTVTSKKEDADVAVEINITSSQNIQVEVEVAECEVDENGKMIKKSETMNSLSNFNSSAPLSEHSRKNLKRLGVLYSDTDQISSPIQRTEENFCENKVNCGRPIKKFTKLAALADDINSWDDDYSKHSTNTQSFSSPKKNINASPFKKAFNSPSASTSTKIPSFNFGGNASSSSSPSLKKESKVTDNNASPKKLVWDKKVIDSLEAQGFSRRLTSGTPKLTYDYNNKLSVAKPNSSSPVKIISVSKPSSTTVSNVSLPTKTTASPAKKEFQKILQTKVNERSRASIAFGKKDPAEMSLKERMAIFEKNKGKAPIPATPFGIADANPIRSNLPELKKKFDFGFKTTTSTNDSETNESASGNIKSTVSQLLSKTVPTISEKQINNEIRKQREEDMKCIMNRYNQQNLNVSQNNIGEDVTTKCERKRRSSNEDNSSNEQEADIDEKRARISTKNSTHARLYPVLSDIETTDTEMDNYTTATVSCSETEKIDQGSSSDEEDQLINTRLSIGREILDSVRKHNDLSNHSYLESTVSSTDVSETVNDMDDYLNEALDDENDSKDYDDKGSACSDSFEYARYPAKRVSFKDVKNNDQEEIPIKSRLEISPAKSPRGSMTLVHTVSFYRRQQSANSANNTPIKKVLHKAQDESSKSNDEFNVASTSQNINRKTQEESDNKSQRLLDEVMRQQAVIKQTSQALNLCASTFEFSGINLKIEINLNLISKTPIL